MVDFGKTSKNLKKGSVKNHYLKNWMNNYDNFRLRKKKQKICKQ